VAAARTRIIACLAGIAAAVAPAGAAAALRPPTEVPAYVLVAQNQGELLNAAGDSACAFARAQPNNTKRLLILPFGRAYWHAGTYGSDLHNVTFTNAQIYGALTNAATVYEGCRDDAGGVGKRVVIAYAVGNNSISDQPAGVPEKIGFHQFKVAHRLDAAGWPHVSAAVAGDIEPGYDPGANGTYPVAATKSLVRGAAEHGLAYYDYGTAGLCPPVAQCQGKWSFGALGQISRGYGSGGAPGHAQPIPEIYSIPQALQWSSVRSRWEAAKRSPYSFAGAMAEPTKCAYTTLAPAASWSLLRRRNLGTPVAPELIFFNPDAIDC